MSRIYIYIKIVLSQIIAIVLFIFQQNREIWIVSEKKTEARDNGYHFYKYLVTAHCNLEAYYVMKRHSPDYEKLKGIGKVVEYDSWKHCVLFFLAKHRVCSQLHGVLPYENVKGVHRFFFWKRPGQKQTHLKHGIAKDLLEAYDYKKNGYDLLICGAIPEYNYYKAQFNYPDRNIALTGLCRFDALKVDADMNNYILIMPTFREWLRVDDSSKREASELEMIKFRQSNYFQAYFSLLTNKSLLSKVKREGLKIIFYLHYTFQPYCKAFQLTVNENVIVASRDSFDVQDLLKHANLLVTDYSSVYSDFAYLCRPIVYYQFDEAEYRDKHYKKGYFDYRRDGFGPVFLKADSVIDYIIGCIDSGFSVEDKYINRRRDYFAFNDSNNCERVYKAILNLN